MLSRPPCSQGDDDALAVSVKSADQSLRVAGVAIWVAQTPKPIQGDSRQVIAAEPVAVAAVPVSTRLALRVREWVKSSASKGPLAPQDRRSLKAAHVKPTVARARNIILRNAGVARFAPIPRELDTALSDEAH